MNPAQMAAVHAMAFADARPWSAEEIAGLIDAPGGFAVTAPGGFALGRAIAGEAELLTIAVDPASRRQGIGRALLGAFEDAARTRRAAKAFLEVAADNHAALALYRGADWQLMARRAGYYSRHGERIDALIFSRSLETPGCAGTAS